MIFIIVHARVFDEHLLKDGFIVLCNDTRFRSVNYSN